MKKSMSKVATSSLALCLLNALPQGVQAQNYSRTDTITYNNNLSLWVIGQQETSTNVETGLVEARTDYDPATALPYQTFAFGKLQQTLTYDVTSPVESGQRGSLKTVSDGRDTTTYNTKVTLTNWKRGIPRLITFPDGKTKSAAVSDLGLIESVTDEIGAQTCYEFDEVGRLSKITYPAEGPALTCAEYHPDTNPSGWNSTTLSFTPVTSNPKFGLPAGHWKQTVTTGNGVKNTYFDAYWRPLVVETYDTGSPTTTTSISVTRYDAEGRRVYQSYPVPSLINFATITQGTRTQYDALGRPWRVEQDSELGVLATTTDYLAGFKTQVKTPLHQGSATTTTTSYKTYDQPSTDWPVAVVQPEGVYTDIARDVFGKPKSITRRNATGSVSSTRSYVYYDTQELCKTVEPETKATVMGYDAAGNLSWSASGLNLLSATTCDETYVPANTVVSRTYNARNWLSTLTFPDGLGDQTWQYAGDGLPSQIITYNGPNHTTAAINAYSYNHRRLLGGQGESIAQDGWYTWSLGYGYDRNGSLSTHVYPGNLTIDYAPNALGQATKAGTFATGVSYHPNGAVKQFTYGNSIVHTMTPNARMLPDVSRDAYGTQEVLDDGYDYDHNGNVVAVSDGATLDAHGNRTMSYDDLDRLETVTSTGMFGGTFSYTYDVLDNIETLVAPGRNLRYCYQATTKRLEFIRSDAANCTSGSATTYFQFDDQGNLATKNGQEYDFDHGNRLRSVTGVEAYRYDGHGRRILAWSATGLGNIISMYSNDGALRVQSDVRRGKVLQHVYLAGSLVATREYPIAGGAASVKYQHTDALGTPVAVTDAARNVIERNDYEPYGKRLNGPGQDKPGYTGHVEDAQTGLTYMQQRYYDPAIGRFLSVDPVTANSKNGSNFNRYWYANNNPYLYRDPDGRYICKGSASDCKTIATALADVAKAAGKYKEGSNERKALDRISDFYGKAGQDNGVTVKVQWYGDSSGSARTTAAGTTIMINLDASNTAANGNQKIYAADVAATLTHEGSHGFDQKRQGYMTRNESKLRWGERRAGAAEALLFKGLGVDAPSGVWTRAGGISAEAINAQAEASMDSMNED